jgi:hypothetical protein
MEISIILLGIVLLGAWLVMRSKRWKTLLTATDPNAEELEAKYEHLRSNKVKCKLVMDASPVAGTGIIPAADVNPGGAGKLIKLKVHQKDLEQAKELLEDFPEAM